MFSTLNLSPTRRYDYHLIICLVSSLSYCQQLITKQHPGLPSLSHPYSHFICFHPTLFDTYHHPRPLSPQVPSHSSNNVVSYHPTSPYPITIQSPYSPLSLSTSSSPAAPNATTISLSPALVPPHSPPYPNHHICPSCAPSSPP